MQYKIKETAELFNINTNKLRFYEKKGLLKPKRDEDNNYRYYSEEDLIKLQTILMYRVLNLPIDEIKDILVNDYKDNMLDHFYKQWEVVNDEIHKMQLIKDSLEEIMDGIYELDEEKYHKSIRDSVKRIHQLDELKNNWKDRWNFNGWAKRYDEAVKKNIGHLKLYEDYEEVLDRVYNQAVKDQSKDMEILEIGVGTGNLAGRFLQGELNIIGIDQSREMLNMAKEKYPKLKLRLGEFLKIPYENSRFDVIVSTYAFHHLNDDEKKVALQEMIRVLKDKGKIVIGDLMFKDEGDKEDIMKNLSQEQISEIEDEYYTNIEKLKAEVEFCGKTLQMTRMTKLVYVIEIQ